MDPLHEEMLRQAVKAVKEGDAATAQDLISDVLEQDENNIQAWLLFARITKNIDERRMALGIILEKEPENARAKEMMAKLQESVGSRPGRDDIIPGISRRMFMMMAGGVAVVVLLLIVIVVMTNSRQAADEREQEQEAQIVAQQATDIIVQQTAAVTLTQQSFLNATATWLAQITATPSPTGTATNTPTFTPTSTRATALPPPAEATGSIFGWSREKITSGEDYPLVAFSLAAIGTRTTVGELQGRYVSVSPDGQLVLYTQDIRSNAILLMSSPEGQALISGVDRILQGGDLAYGETMMGRFSSDGTRYVFIGEAIDNGTQEVYLMTLPADRARLNPNNTSTGSDSGFVAQRLTRDERANYSFPMMSPDGQKVVVVREDFASDNPGRDLVIIDIATGTTTPLTTDRDLLAEYHPAWAPNGEVIVFSAVAEGQAANNRDLYIIPARGGSAAAPMVVDPADDSYPVYSPDGRYIAFASNRGPNYNIFIYDTASQQVSAQVTDLDYPTFPGGWANP